MLHVQVNSINRRSHARSGHQAGTFCEMNYWTRRASSWVSSWEVLNEILMLFTTSNSLSNQKVGARSAGGQHRRRKRHDFTGDTYYYPLLTYVKSKLISHALLFLCCSLISSHLHMLCNNVTASAGIVVWFCKAKLAATPPLLWLYGATFLLLFPWSLF
jgi:hypothetical protein